MPDPGLYDQSQLPRKPKHELIIIEFCSVIYSKSFSQGYLFLRIYVIHVPGERTASQEFDHPYHKVAQSKIFKDVGQEE